MRSVDGRRHDVPYGRSPYGTRQDKLKGRRTRVREIREKTVALIRHEVLGAQPRAAVMETDALRHTKNLKAKGVI